MSHTNSMHSPSQYRGYRFPRELISHSVWLYHRFCLSFRDIEDLRAERGVIVSYEAIRQWCTKFGPSYASSLRKRAGRLGDTWFMDEVHIVTIQGGRHYLWRAVDQDSNVIDILVQKRKDKRAAKHFFRKDAETPKWIAEADGHRQASKLCGCEVRGHACHGTFSRSLCQQSGGGITPAHPTT